MVAQCRATVGGLASGATNITPALPSGWQPDDILVMMVETANEAVTAPAGWTQAPNSPVSQTNADVTRLTVLYRRAVAGDGNPTITDPGDHAGARIIAVSGCVTTGDPWDVTAGAPDNTSSTTADIPTGTTTARNGLVVVGVATGLSGVANSAQHSAWTNAGLLQGPASASGMVERFDSRYTAGNGGSIGCATGQKLDIGAVGTTTSTMAAADTKACWSGVLKSAATPIEFLTAAVSVADSTNYTTTAIAPAPDAVVVAFVAVSGPAADPTMTGLSLTWTRQKVVSVSSGTDATKLAYFTAPAGASPTSGAATITSSGNTGANWAIYQLNGANASTPIVQDPSTFTTTTPANVTLTFAAAADASNRQVVAAVVTPQNSANSITPEAGWTEDAEVVRSTPSLKLWSARQLTTFDTSITITDDSTYDFAVIGLEVNMVQGKTIDGTLAVTSTGAAAATTSKPVTAALAETVTGAAAATAAKPVDAALSETVTTAAAATASKPADATSVVTATTTGTATTTKPVDAALPVTTATTAATTTAKPATGDLPVTATGAAALGVAHTVSGDLPVAVGLAAALDVVNAVEELDGTRPITVTTTADATTGKAPSGSTTVAVAADGALGVGKAPTGDLPVSVGLDAALLVVAAGKNINGDLQETVTRTATADTTKPVDAALAVTATVDASLDVPRSTSGNLVLTVGGAAVVGKATTPGADLAVGFTATAGMTVQKAVTGNLAVTVDRVAELLIGTPPKTVDGSLPVSWTGAGVLAKTSPTGGGLTVAATSVGALLLARPAAADLPIGVALTAGMTVSKAITGDLAVTVGRVSTATVDGEDTRGGYSPGPVYTKWTAREPYVSDTPVGLGWGDGGWGDGPWGG